MKADAPGSADTKDIMPPQFAEGVRKSLLRSLLRDVSRSFYLTLRVLPQRIQPQIGLAYLMARAADTIADTKVVPRARRLAALLQLRKQFDGSVSASEVAAIQQDLSPHQSLPAEKLLLEKLDQCFRLFTSFAASDQRLIAEVVQTLTHGMEFDLTRFPGESADKLAALEKPEELDEYTYYVAGCVGPFWTKMCVAHLKELKNWDAEKMCELGIRFGKGLQLCNVLRDIPKDLRIGRCYLPSSELAAIGLKPSDLFDAGVEAAVPGGAGTGQLRSPNPTPPGTAASTTEKLRPLFNQYLDLALSHLEAGWQYTMAVPASLPRLRLACAWPILIGLKTLAKLRNNPDILNSDRRIKITRGVVYSIMARTYFSRSSDPRLNRYYNQLVQEAK